MKYRDYLTDDRAHFIFVGQFFPVEFAIVFRLGHMLIRFETFFSVGEIL